jgi:hypothetical protein
MRSLPILVIIFSLTASTIASAQVNSVPDQPLARDKVLATALAECDREAEQARASAPAAPPFDATHIIVPLLLLGDVAQRKKQQDELPARLALIEQNRVQCQANATALASRRLQEVQNQANDAALGYRPISIEDFALDAAEMAKAGRKVALRGAYLLSDNLDLLFADQNTIIRVLYAPNIARNTPSVPLLTKNANRPFRQLLLRCQTNPAGAQSGCPVAITGVVTTCKLTGPLGLEREMPCVDVENGRPL